MTKCMKILIKALFPQRFIAVSYTHLDVYKRQVEMHGWGSRQFVVAGSKGKVEIKPIENTTCITYANPNISLNEYEDEKEILNIGDIPKDCRYDAMMQDFYDYILGKKENPYSYGHELSVHKVLTQICGGTN